MQQINNSIILRRKDYDILVKYTFSRLTPLSNDNKNAEQLYEELRLARVVDNENEFPEDAIGINSTVEVVEKTTNKNMIFKIVLPKQANVSKHRVSVFAPLAIALMGYRTGQRINWEMPSGTREFYVKSVINKA